MIHHHVAVASLLLLVSPQALAVPSAFLLGSDRPNPNFNWTVTATPDADLFSDNPPNGFGGSLGLALYVEVPLLITNSVEVESDFMEAIDGTVIENIGIDPYINQSVSGLQIHHGVPGIVFDDRLVDAIYAPLGSTYFTTGGEKLVLSFSTGSLPTWYGLGGRIAQAGDTFELYPLRIELDLFWADYNNDLQVDSGDLSLLLGHWGESVPPVPADWTGPPPTGPKVDANELSLLLGSWGIGVPLGSTPAAGQTVPEPASLFLLAVGLCALSLSRFWNNNSTLEIPR